MSFVVSPRSAGPRDHLPVAMVIDRSTSTARIRQLLNASACRMLESMRSELMFRGIVELLVIHFSSEVEVKVNFQPLEQVRPEDLCIQQSHGFTATGLALNRALELLDRKKLEWGQRAEHYYQPLLFLLTDGYPNAGRNAPPRVVQVLDEAYRNAARIIRQKEQAEKIVFIGAGIQQQDGEKANMEKLRELTLHPDRVLTVNDAAGGARSIEQFYRLIHESTRGMYQGTPIDDVVGQIWNL